MSSKTDYMAMMRGPQAEGVRRGTKVIEAPAGSKLTPQVMDYLDQNAPGTTMIFPDGSSYAGGSRTAIGGGSSSPRSGW